MSKDKKEISEITKQFSAYAFVITLIPAIGAVAGFTVGGVGALSINAFAKLAGCQDPTHQAVARLGEFGMAGGALVGAGWAMHSTGIDTALLGIGSRTAGKLARKIFGAPKTA